jgi:oligopeptide transport system substrate-binding protein
MKRRLAFLLALVMLMAVCLTGCGSKTPAATTSAAVTGKQLVAELGPNPETIDPALNSSVDGANMIIFAFDGLLNLDKDNNVIAGAAEKWETSTDGLTWTFHLRSGLKWSDGSALTAKDFVYSWQRVADPKTAAPYAETVLGMVEGYADVASGAKTPDTLGVSAPDDNTFVVKLATPCPYFDKLAAFPTLSPVNQATIEKNGDSWATKAESYICNGPFYISEWVPSSYIVFTKNPNYRDADSIKLGSIKLLLMEDANAAYAAYTTGEAMMIKDVPTANIPSLQGKSDFHVDPDMGTYYISLNDAKEPFTNAKVRQALSLAIDRDYVANTLMQGVYTPAYNFIGTGITDWDGSAFMDNANGGKPYISKDYKANLAQAKQLLSDAGYPDGKGLPTITYSTNDVGYHKVVAQYLQQAWAQLGVKMDISVVEWASFTPQRRAGDYEVARNGWLFDYNDPSNMLTLLYSTNGNNDGKYNNKDYDALIDKSASETDPQTRFGYLHQAEDLLMADAACIPVAYYNDFYLCSTNVTGYWHSPYGFWYFQYADVA